jgi:disulfide bond formation protein DsbB
MIQAITVLLALGTLVADVAVALFVFDALIGWLFNNKILSAFAPMREWVAHHAIELGFSVSLLATLGSLFFSNVVGFAPCELCWWIRICIYPQVVIFALALAYQRRGRPVGPVFSISGMLSAIGALISLYQYYGATFNASILSACNVTGVSCAKTYFVEFGYITIPVMSLTACVLLLGICFAKRRA